MHVQRFPTITCPPHRWPTRMFGYVLVTSTLALVVHGAREKCTCNCNSSAISNFRFFHFISMMLGVEKLWEDMSLSPGKHIKAANCASERASRVRMQKAGLLNARLNSLLISAISPTTILLMSCIELGIGQMIEINSGMLRTR